MKKILFATTALVATAGVASAQDLGVALTGTAEMGVFSVDTFDFTAVETTDGDTQFFTDLDIRFTMSGVADNGLTFGATIDLDEAADINNPGRFEAPGQQGGEAVFVSFGGATFTMGDTDGAYDARMAEMALAGGSLNDDETVHAGFDTQDGVFPNFFEIAGLDGSGDGQVARFDYSVNTLTFSVSMEQEANGASGSDDIFGLGVSYDAEVAGLNVGLGLGYQVQDDLGNSLGVTATTQFSNGISAGLTLSRFLFEDDGLETQRHAGIGLGYEMNQLAVGINYGKFTNVLGVDGADQQGVGLAAAYDLGGGLSARFGYGYSKFEDGGQELDGDRFSAGLQMSF